MRSPHLLFVLLLAAAAAVGIVGAVLIKGRIASVEVFAVEAVLRYSERITELTKSKR